MLSHDKIAQAGTQTYMYPAITIILNYSNPLQTSHIIQSQFPTPSANRCDPSPVSVFPMEAQIHGSHSLTMSILMQLKRSCYLKELNLGSHAGKGIRRSDRDALSGRTLQCFNLINPLMILAEQVLLFYY